MDLKGRVVVITGAGRGIGEATALAFASEGASVVLAARTERELERVASSVVDLGAEARIVPADVSRKEDVAHLFQSALNSFGQVDVVVNAAGMYGPIGLMWDVDVDEWMRAAQVNLFGTFLCCHEVLPHMVERRKGKIINFSGGGATSPLPAFSAYGVSKTAIVRLTEVLAEEARPYNVQVNAIAPGAVDTRLQDQVLAAGERAGKLLSMIQKMRQTGEGGVPRELAARLCVFLASDASGDLTGKLIAASHDGWERWDSKRIAELAASPWLTLRRLDPFTVRPLMDELMTRVGS